ASQLREVGERVADTVGQGEAQQLLAAGYARELIDRFGGSDVAALKGGLRRRFEQRRRLAEGRDALRGTDARAAAEREHARYALAEIDAAGLGDPDEDERLRERRDVLTHAERIAEGLARAQNALENEGG